MVSKVSSHQEDSGFHCSPQRYRPSLQFIESLLHLTHFHEYFKMTLSGKNFLVSWLLSSYSSKTYPSEVYTIVWGDQGDWHQGKLRSLLEMWVSQKYKHLQCLIWNLLVLFSIWSYQSVLDCCSGTILISSPLQTFQWIAQGIHSSVFRHFMIERHR